MKINVWQGERREEKERKNEISMSFIPIKVVNM